MKPSVAPPKVENIPIELRQRRQWVCWAFEWRADKSGGGKWTKVPYTPGEIKKARSNAPSTWRSFDLALQSYHERADFFAGIGYMFLKDDPYVGGDRDHSLNTDGIPPTYAEISPSGNGIKFIGKANGTYGRKTARGELYSAGRFFTITGNVLPGHERITNCQVGIDAFLASLGNPDRPTRAGTPGDGTRAAAAAAIPQKDYAEGRRLLRNEINSLLARLRASVRPKAPGKETQLYYVLNEDYRGLHNHYPYVGVIRADGSIDSSQLRAIFANGVRMRRFTFPQYIALFHHFYGAECAAKWGTTQAFREEAAFLWFRARAPRTAEALPTIPAPVKRGRGSDHAELLTRTYATLETFKVGVDAVLCIPEMAEIMNISPRSVAKLLAELATEGRITKHQFGQHGGLLISFSGMHNEKTTSADVPHTEHTNGHSTEPLMGAGGFSISPTSGMHNESGVSQDRSGENNTPMSAEPTGQPLISGMHNDTDDDQELTAPECGETTPTIVIDEREKEAPLIVYISNTVYLPQELCIPEKRLSLKDVVTDALDNLPKDKVNSLGELKRWPVTKRRVIEYVQYEYADRGWKPQAIAFWYGKLRKAQKNKAFDDLRALKREALEKKAGAARKEIARYEKLAHSDPNPDLRSWWAKRATQKQGQLAMLGWELGRRDAEDKARIDAEGYSQGEQQEFLELVERERGGTKTPKQPRVSLQPQPSMADGLIDRLRARATEETRGGVAHAS